MDKALPPTGFPLSDGSAGAALLREVAQSAGQLPSGPVDLHSIGSVAVPLNHQVFDNNIVINNLDIDRPQFNVSTGADGSKTFNNIKGLSLDVTTFGTRQQVPITSLRMSVDGANDLSFSTRIADPLPAYVRSVFDASPTIPFAFSLRSDNSLQFPNGSQLFEAMSSTTGTTLPGMVFSDVMKDAGSVAAFTERYPKWTNQVMVPFLNTFEHNVQQSQGAASGSKELQAQIGQAKATPSERLIQPKTAPANPARLEAGQTVTENLRVDGRDRSFIVHVPPSYDPGKPTPLVLMLHGLGETGADVQKLANVDAIADKNGFIVAYPNSVDWLNVRGLHVWDTGNGLLIPGQHTNDVRFLNNVIDSIQGQANIDDRRVYMTGLSNGGMMAFLAGSELSGRLAAIAIVSGAMSGKEPNPAQPLSLMNVHGTADPIIPIGGLTDTPPVLTDAGLPTFQSTQWATDHWKKIDGITAPYTVQKNGNVTIEKASNPNNGTEVEQYVIAGSGHIPDNREQLMQQVWDFLKQHPRTSAPDPKQDHIQEPSDPITNWYTVRQLQNDVKARGIKGMESDFDRIFDAARQAPDGTIYPARLFNQATSLVHLHFHDPVTSFIEQTRSISKRGDAISVNRSHHAKFNVGADFGPGMLKSIDINNPSFEMNLANGYPQLKNIKGIALNAQVAGFNLSSRIQGITEKPEGKNADGRIYEATMQNPLPGWLRTVLMSPDTVNVDLRLKQNGMPEVANAAQTEKQLIGADPETGGLAVEAQDAVNAATNPTAGNVLRLTSDAAFTAGLTYAGARLGGKLLGGVGLLATPAIVDLVRRQFD